jgi:hypothetical protein
MATHSIPPDDEIIFHIEGHFSGWLDRLRILFGKPIRIHIIQPVWFKLEGPRIFLAVKQVEPNITVEPFRKRKPKSATSILDQIAEEYKSK